MANRATRRRTERREAAEQRAIARQQRASQPTLGSSLGDLLAQAMAASPTGALIIDTHLGTVESAPHPGDLAKAAAAATTDRKGGKPVGSINFIQKLLTIVERAGGQPMTSAAIAVAADMHGVTPNQIRDSLTAYARRNPQGPLARVSPGIFAWRAGTAKTNPAEEPAPVPKLPAQATVPSVSAPPRTVESAVIVASAEIEPEEDETRPGVLNLRAFHRFEKAKKLAAELNEVLDEIFKDYEANKEKARAYDEIVRSMNRVDVRAARR